jgi:hypothetical protein
MGATSSSTTVQNPLPSKSCSATVLAEPVGLFSDSVGRVLLDFWVLDALVALFSLGLRHSHAQCLGLPQLWQLPWWHSLWLPSDPVAVRALLVSPSSFFSPCPH